MLFVAPLVVLSQSVFHQ
uniref:Uncharacterized protein n=1 Tax=Timema douglasi TaxID=61478 RepID=A0A7R8ZIF9_TIMDO|nr:unnamed protein product [Timema douglasi]